MTAHNGIEYSKKCIPSIKTRYPYQLLLINDRSSDGTKEYFDRLKNERENTIVIHNPPTDSLSGVWNLGIVTAFRDSECEYCLVINNDILFHPKCIDNLVDFAELYPDWAVPTAAHIPRESNPNAIFNYSLPNKLEIRRFMSFGCFLFTRLAIEQVGLFDENYKMFRVEDCDYRMRIVKTKAKSAGLTTALIYHFVGGAPKCETDEWRRKLKAQILENRKYFKQKFGFPLYGPESKYDPLLQKYFDWLEKDLNET